MQQLETLKTETMQKVDAIQSDMDRSATTELIILCHFRRLSKASNQYSCAANRK